jgi:oligopeptide transport system permease protein
MGKYITKRIVMSAITLLVILLILFLMLDLMPGSPFNDEKLTEVQKALLYTKYGLDQPFFIRFSLYLKNVLRGDFGVSYAINQNFSVTEMMLPRLAISLSIGLQAMVLGSFVGIILGVIAALNHNTWIDTLTSAVSVIGVSVPSYVLALGLAYFFGYKLRLVPFLYDVRDPATSSILPIVALSVFTVANIARFTRSELLDVLGSDYILLAESKGIKQYKMIIKHALRNAMIPVVTIMGPLLVGLLTGSMVVERIFSIPGIGGLMVDAIGMNDYNVVIACSFVYSALYVIAMLIVDILYGIIDPRIRVAKEGK